MKNKCNFVEGKTYQSLIRMFFPLMAAMILTMIYNMVDSLWVGNLLGEKGLSAMTTGTAIVLIMNSLAMGFGNGVTVLVANMVGANKKNEMPGTIATIMVVSIVLSTVLLVVGELVIDSLLLVMGTPIEIINDAAIYLKIYFIGNAALFIYMQFTSIFRGFGDSSFQMLGMLITAIFNAVADPFCIKLWGLAGAAIATLIAEATCLVFAFAYYKKKKLFNIDFRKMKGSTINEVFSLGIPTTIQAIMPPLSSAFMISFINSFGTTAIAGFGVGRNLELIMFMPTTGMCMAITSITGQCIGAGRRDRAKDYLKAGMILGGLLIAVLSTIVVLFSGQLTAAFGQGEMVEEIVCNFFKIISIGYVLYMLTSCIQGYVTGARKPFLAMILLVLYYIVFRIPMAAILKPIYGINGIWMAFLISHILAFVTGLLMLKAEKDLLFSCTDI